MQGRVDKIAKEMALLEQAFVKDTSKTVAGRAACTQRPAPLVHPFRRVILHPCGDWQAWPGFCRAPLWVVWPDRSHVHEGM